MNDWIKRHWLVLVLILLLGWVGSRGRVPMFLEEDVSFDAATSMQAFPGVAEDIAVSREALSIAPEPFPDAPPIAGDDRLVIQDTSLSLLVTDVAEAIAAIKNEAESRGGYLVQSNLSKPEEAASGSISIRVPSDELDDTLAAFRAIGLRVVHESVQGRDVTDQYVDLEARLETLETTKTKFLSILDNAVEISDILQVQRELVSLQSQIDRVVGQQKLLSQSAQLTKVVVYLSTDELALPYAPDTPWRPSVIVKLAIRSLVTNVRSLGSLLIWVGVYAVVWVPILVIIWYLRKRNRASRVN